jgi:hypothetical protein
MNLHLLNKYSMRYIYGISIRNIQLTFCLYLFAFSVALVLLLVWCSAYHSRFIPEGVADASQIFLRDAQVLLKLLSYEEYCRRDRW